MFRKLLTYWPTLRVESDTREVDAPPPYTEICTRSSKTYVELKSRAEDRLRRLLVWRIADEWGLKPFVPDAEKPSVCEYVHFKKLCMKYCKVLGLQFSSRAKVHRARKELMEAIFNPASALGIPSDLMEFFLFSVRTATKNASDGRSGRLVPGHDSIMIIRVILDCRILVHIATKDVIFIKKLEMRCRDIYYEQFPYLLGPDHIELQGALNMRPPSFFDQPSYWPNVIHLMKQSRRPCPFLKNTSVSHRYKVEMGYPRKKDPFSPPRLAESVIRDWSCQLPDDIVCGWYRWTNPEGRVPRSVASWNGDLPPQYAWRSKRN